MDRPTIGVPEAAAIAGVNILTVRAWVRAGKFKVTRNRLRPGQPIVIDFEDFNRFIREKTS